MSVNKNPAVHCLFMFTAHSLMLTNTDFDFNNVLVNVEINFPQKNNYLNEHKKNHGKDFHMINMLYFDIMQFCYSNLI